MACDTYPGQRRANGTVLWLLLQQTRGMRKKEENNDNARSELVTVKSDISRKKFRKNWARLIRKIYNVDPLLCPKCSNEMWIISFIEDDATIKKILMHLGLWMTLNHDPPLCKNDLIALHIQSHRSFEWWESMNRVSGDEDYNDGIAQTPYEDEYSQPGCLGEQWERSVMSSLTSYEY